MHQDKGNKQSLVDRILETEWEMFQAVPTLARASCQDDPEGFSVMRGSQFMAWSVQALESYLDDLGKALASGKNLMTIKYARMAEQIPRVSQNPVIGRIVEIQVAWQKELLRKYPHVIGRGRGVCDADSGPGGTSFSRYLAGELETYSDKTLEILYGDILRHLENNENMSERIYRHMARNMGYKSLEEAEKSSASQPANRA